MIRNLSRPVPCMIGIKGQEFAAEFSAGVTLGRKGEDSILLRIPDGLTIEISEETLHTWLDRIKDVREVMEGG